MYWKLIISIAIWGFITSSGCNRNNQAGPGENEGSYAIEINGSLKDGAGKQVVLEKMEAREYVPEDTVSCDESGSFNISFSNEEPGFYVLRYGPSGYVTLLLEPGELVEFAGIYGQTDTYNVKGSEGSALLRKLAMEHKRTLRAMGEISRMNSEMVSNPDYAMVKAELDRQFDSIAGSFYNYSLDFIYKNSHSLSILIAIYNLYGQGLPVFQPDRDFHIYQFVDSALMSRFPGFDAVGLLHSQVEEAKQLMENETPVRPLQKGEIAPDFVSSQPNGEELALYDLKGNYVLVSFWAGWSRLSREENGTLREAYKIHQHQPFRILQVSLDEEKDSWTGAILEDELIWDHVSDLLRWDSRVVNLYRIEKIPSNVLIDPAGRIIDTDLFGNRLLEKLETIFMK